MKNNSTVFHRKVEAYNELKQAIAEKVWAKVFAVYLFLDLILLSVKKCVLFLLFFLAIPSNLLANLRTFMKIVGNYGFLAMDEDGLCSSQRIDLIPKTTIESSRFGEKVLHVFSRQNRIFTKSRKLIEVKYIFSIADRSLVYSAIASLYACAKINTISQFKLRERERKKREPTSRNTKKIVGRA